MVDSREKGARGEREFAHFLTNAGFPAERGQQHKGGKDSPDVICESLPGIHWEVKRVQRLHLLGAVEQAIKDAGLKVPVVAHRVNDGEWFATLPLSDFLNFLKWRQDHDAAPG